MALFKLRRVMMMSLVLVAIGWAQVAAPDQERIWKDFVEWYKKQSPDEPDLKQAYLNLLRGQGLSDNEAKERFALVMRLADTRESEIRSINFDQMYRSSKPHFTTKPNAFLAQMISGRKPGRALDIHMGQGRNAVFLATQGWDVTGFDFSSEGIQKANEDAKRAGVRINGLVARHEEFDFGIEKWDLIVMTYTFIPLKSSYIQAICRSLKPDGLLVFENFVNDSKNPAASDRTPAPNQLLTTFPGLRVLHYEDRTAEADWSKGSSRIAQLLAQKSVN